MTSPVSREPVLTISPQHSPVKEAPKSPTSQEYIAAALAALQFSSPEREEGVFIMDEEQATVLDSPEYKMKQSKGKHKRISTKTYEKEPKAKKNLSTFFQDNVVKK